MYRKEKILIVNLDETEASNDCVAEGQLHLTDQLTG
jgi:hypothetical protein